MRPAPRGGARQLPQGREVVQDPDRPAVRPDHEIALVDVQIAHRAGGEIEPQRLPMVAVVERNVNAAFGTREQQAATLGVFPYDVHDFIRRYSLYDLLPRLSAVPCAGDVGRQIVEPEAVDSSVGSQRVE